MITAPQCIRCIHFLGYESALHCAAYPKEIPFEILTNKIIHNTPYPGDKGIVFEAKPYTPLDDEDLLPFDVEL